MEIFEPLVNAVLLAMAFEKKRKPNDKTLVL